MRFNIGYIAPSNKRQYQFSCGMKDLEILDGLVTKACQSMPALSQRSNPEYRDIYDRMRAMRKDLSEGLAEAMKLGDDGTRVHNPPSTESGEIVNENLSENEA